MPAAGQNFNETILVAEAPEIVSQRIIAGASGVDGCSVTTVGVGSILITRKYRPTWAIVVAVIGILLFLIGLLALLYTVTETLTITIAAEGEGTRITVTGTSSQEMLSRITSVLSGLAMSAGTGSGQLSPSAGAPVDSKQCPACAETVKAEARVCRFCGHEFSES